MGNRESNEYTREYIGEVINDLDKAARDLDAAVKEYLIEVTYEKQFDAYAAYTKVEKALETLHKIQRSKDMNGDSHGSENGD